MKKITLLLMACIVSMLGMANTGQKNLLAESTEVADIAAFIAAKNTTQLVTITGTVSIAYVNEYTNNNNEDRSNVFLQDASGWIMMYSTSMTNLQKGQALVGLQGKYKLNFGTSQIVEPVIPDASAGPFISPVAKSIQDLTDADVNRYIMVKDVSIVERVEGKYTNKYAVDASGNELWIFDKFKTGLVVKVGNTYDLVGILTMFNSKLELAFTSITDKGSGVDEIQLLGIQYDGSVISNPYGVEIALYTVSGKQLISTSTEIDLSDLHSGVYILATPKGILKIAK